MSKYFNPQLLVTVQRYKFYSRFRKPGESISSFVVDLGKDCAFDGTSLEENLRDRLVRGISYQSIQKKFCQSIT